MLGVRRVGEHVEQFGVPTGSAAVFGRAGTMPVHAARRRAAGPEHLDVVGPAIAEVVEVFELGAEIGQPGTGFVTLVLGPHLLAGNLHPVGFLRCDELVQMRVGPPDRGLQQLVQLGQGRRRWHIDHPGDGRLDVTQHHPQARGVHRCGSASTDVGAAQHFLYLTPDPHQHG